MKKKQNSLPSRREIIVCIALMALVFTAATIGFANASKYSNNNRQKNCNEVNVHFIAGSDSQRYPTNFPAATVYVASNHNYAHVALSLFPSASNVLQPATCYTDLLRIKNYGKTCNIKSITISNIEGASNLGNLTIYFYKTQTNSPQTQTPIASASLNSSSKGTINLLSNSYLLLASAVNYIEVVGYASPDASAGSKISFSLSIQIEEACIMPHKVKGAGSLFMKHSAGTISGDFGSRAYFAFNIKNIQGTVDGEFRLVIFHKDSRGRMHVYQIKSDTPTELSVNKYSGQISVANFTTTGTIYDITRPHRPIIISKNAEIQAALTNYKNKQDTISFTITSPSGHLYFSSNWHGGESVKQSLRSGDLTIY